jgi:glutaredoxin
MSIKFYTTDWCGDCIRSKALLNKLNIQFEEINVDEDKEANEYITNLQNNQRRIPTIVFEDGSFLVEPTDPELHSKLEQLNYL